ncbi:hypothetical protein [Alistipes sp. UBA1686]|uniref:hypothetical protein n=1 Tax=Alistipes sp. UBA1686 TaxID=1946007 RepID=UPI00257C07A4|nr:hypothetical protein [Alistipes sp. UBA1686]
MKKLFRLFLCLALFSGTAACSDDEASQNLIVINGGEHFLSLDGLARAGKISVLAPAPWRVTKARETRGSRFPRPRALRDIPRSN